MKITDEEITIVPYNPLWPELFEQESENIKKIFGASRLVDIRHYGSTSVFGMTAKPVVDILVGVSEFYISDQEKSDLQQLGYVYIENAWTNQRFYFRKRCEQSFNLAVVSHDGDLWRNNLMVREYLRSHPDEAKKYIQVKEQAVSQGHTTLFAYSDFKYGFIVKLIEKAKTWGKKTLVEKTLSKKVSL
ncbi:MAG: GrpB family protein [bacterium]